MKKICHITSAHKSDDVRIFQKECASLAKKSEYEVYLVARGEGRVEKGVHVVGCGEPGNGRLSRIFSFSKKVIAKAIELDADIYHLHDPELLRYALRLKRMGKTVIFDCHENYGLQIRSKEYIPRVFRGIVGAIFEHFQFYVSEKIDAVIVVEKKDMFKGHYKSLEVICNTPMMDELYDRFADTAKKSFSICSVGSISESRGIMDLIDACVMTKTRLILAGGFSSAEYQKRILDIVESEENIEYLGVCSREEVFSIYSEASCGGSVWRNEGQYAVAATLATKVYEFMAMGLPSIINSTAYNDRVMEEYKFGITVPSKDSEKLARAIQYIKNNPKEAKEMGENGRKAILEKFNWGIEETKLFGLYSRLC
jgi:glycosyltransferase involved in cell wall biosynthesis